MTTLIPLLARHQLLLEHLLMSRALSSASWRCRRRRPRPSSSTFSAVTSHRDRCRRHRDRRLTQLDRGVGALEVVALADLACGLVHRVADLLHVDLGCHIERWHCTPPGTSGAYVSSPEPTGYRVGKIGVPRLAFVAHQGRCPSGQRERAVNPSAYAFGGSNPPRPTLGWRVERSCCPASFHPSHACSSPPRPALELLLHVPWRR